MLEDLGIGGVEEDDVRAAVRDHPRDLFGGGRWLDRCGDRSGAQRAQERHRLRDARIGYRRHRLPLPRSVALQRRRDAIHQAIERTVTHPGIVIGDRQRVGLTLRMRADEIGERAERVAGMGRGGVRHGGYG